MSVIEIFIFFIVFVLLEWGYILTAKKFNIVDRPNHRTMHSGLIVRGGGILFVFSYVAYFIYSSSSNYYFLAGLVTLAAICFIDDVKNLPGAIRFAFQMLAVGTIIYDLGLFEIWPWVAITGLFIVVTGILNAFNFMDGINGITAGYSSSLLLILLIINEQLIRFIDTSLVVFLLLSTLAFAVFNFRKRALCFAGDIGSVTMGLMIAYLIVKLIVISGSFLWILLLLVYGLDVVITIIQRLKNRENIFKPHRKHLFQLAIKQLNVSHLLVSSIYSLLQFIIGLIVVLIYSFYIETQLEWSVVLVVLGTGIYLVVKTRITGSVWLS